MRSHICLAVRVGLVSQSQAEVSWAAVAKVRPSGLNSRALTMASCTSWPVSVAQMVR